MKSKYRMGWLFVCFDLPVIEKEELRLANRFRKTLLDLGYYMLQNSVYVRNCVSYEKTDKYIRIIENIAPATGSVHIFFLTDVQWSNSKCIQKYDYHKSKFIKDLGENAPEQMTFW